MSGGAWQIRVEWAGPPATSVGCPVGFLGVKLPSLEFTQWEIGRKPGLGQSKQDAGSPVPLCLSIWPHVKSESFVLDLRWGLCVHWGKDRGQTVSCQSGRPGACCFWSMWSLHPYPGQRVCLNAAFPILLFMVTRSGPCLSVL